MTTENSIPTIEAAGTVDPEPEARTISGFWRRIFAGCIDGFFLGLIGAILGLFFFEFLAQLGGWGRLFGLCIGLAYYGLLNSSIGKGQTLGKRLLKIEVVDEKGEHISLARSSLRVAILDAPYFLNMAMIPSSMIQSPLGLIISFIIFGFIGASIYLYLFNRRTRQSLHDLVVGTFVVKTSRQERVVHAPVWKMHFVIVAVWFLAVLGFVIVSYVTAQKGVFPQLLTVQKKIQATGKVHVASAFVGEKWHTENGVRVTKTYFRTVAVWRRKPEDFEEAAKQIAFVVLREYPEIMGKDALIVTVSYGYDIGIGQSWKNATYNRSPKEWQEVLDLHKDKES